MKKEKKLLDAIGDIDENYVLEAAPKTADAEGLIKSLSPDTQAASDAASQSPQSSNMGTKDGVSVESSRKDNIIYMTKKRNYKSLGVIAAAAIIIIGAGVYMTILKGNESTMMATSIEEAAEMDSEANNSTDGNALTGSGNAYAPETFAEAAADGGANVDALPDEQLRTNKAMSGKAASEEGEAPASDSQETFTSMIANPWLDSDTLEKAEDDAGFEITIPEDYEGCQPSVYRSMSDTMIEIIYKDAAGAEAFRIRKSTESGDISGDYNVYDVEKVIDFNGSSITMKGTGDNIFNVTWTKDNYSYAVTIDETQHFTVEQLKELIVKLA